MNTYPLYPNQFKKIGFGIAILSLLVSFCVLLQGALDEKNFLLCQALGLVGLVFIIFSKEKEENSIIVSYRYEAFKASFGFLISLVIAITFVAIIYTVTFDKYNVLLLSYIGTLFYITYFNILMFITKPQNIEIDLQVRINSNGKRYLIYTLLIIGIVVALFFYHSSK
jgi:hypothetical protein